MKFLTLALVMLMTAFAAFAQGNYLDATGKVQARAKEYITVVNKSAATTFTKGQAVCFNNTLDDGISVDVCAGEGFKPVGIVTDASCAVGARCLLQTKGFIDFGKFDYLANATAVGALIFADVDGDLVRPATVTTAMFPIGVTFDVVAADVSTLEVYIDL